MKNFFEYVIYLGVIGLVVWGLNAAFDQNMKYIEVVAYCALLTAIQARNKRDD